MKKRVTNFRYVASSDERSAMSICNDNGLIITPIAMDSFGNRLKIQITGDGYNQVGKEEYDGTKDVVYKAIYGLYVKLKKKENYVIKKN